MSTRSATRSSRKAIKTSLVKVLPLKAVAYFRLRSASGPSLPIKSSTTWRYCKRKGIKSFRRMWKGCSNQTSTSTSPTLSSNTIWTRAARSACYKTWSISSYTVPSLWATQTTKLSRSIHPPSQQNNRNGRAYLPMRKRKTTRSSSSLT